ncbi:hypothetical protein [Kitasatospora sp. NPDC088134]|uniref:hypothetical protein n=1 Tax=Kitasatospora sp. NPDC088134 TaxID=3364071 RepID=UPI00381347F1
MSGPGAEPPRLDRAEKHVAVARRVYTARRPSSLAKELLLAVAHGVFVVPGTAEGAR